MHKARKNYYWHFNEIHRIADAICGSFCPGEYGKKEAIVRMRINIKPSCFCRDLTPYAPIYYDIDKNFRERYPSFFNNVANWKSKNAVN